MALIKKVIEGAGSETFTFATTQSNVDLLQTLTLSAPVETVTMEAMGHGGSGRVDYESSYMLYSPGSGGSYAKKTLSGLAAGTQLQIRVDAARSGYGDSANNRFSQVTMGGTVVLRATNGQSWGQTPGQASSCIGDIAFSGGAAGPLAYSFSGSPRAGGSAGPLGNGGAATTSSHGNGNGGTVAANQTSPDGAGGSDYGLSPGGGSGNGAGGHGFVRLTIKYAAANQTVEGDLVAAVNVNIDAEVDGGSIRSSDVDGDVSIHIDSQITATNIKQGELGADVTLHTSAQASGVRVTQGNLEATLNVEATTDMSGDLIRIREGAMDGIIAITTQAEVEGEYRPAPRIVEATMEATVKVRARAYVNSSTKQRVVLDTVNNEFYVPNGVTTLDRIMAWGKGGAPGAQYAYYDTDLGGDMYHPGAGGASGNFAMSLNVPCVPGSRWNASIPGASSLNRNGTVKNPTYIIVGDDNPYNYPTILFDPAQNVVLRASPGGNATIATNGDQISKPGLSRSTDIDIGQIKYRGGNGGAVGAYTKSGFPYKIGGSGGGTPGPNGAGGNGLAGGNVERNSYVVGGLTNGPQYEESFYGMRGRRGGRGNRWGQPTGPVSDVSNSGFGFGGAVSGYIHNVGLFYGQNTGFSGAGRVVIEYSLLWDPGPPAPSGDAYAMFLLF